MKFKITLTPNTEIVPFSYLHNLMGVFHYWLGPNDLHGMLSLYSVGMLQGGTLTEDKSGLTFPHGATLEIGILNTLIAERLISGLLLKPPVFYGMKVAKVDRLKPPVFSNRKFVFQTGSPVILRNSRDDGSREYILFNNPEASFCLKRVMDHKIREAGLTEFLGDYVMYFDSSYRNPKTKLIKFKETQNKGSICPLIVIGKPELLEFVWTVGAGELTGSGFGSLTVSLNVRSHFRSERVSEKLSSNI